MSNFLSEKNTIKALSLPLLLCSSFLYSMQSSAAVLERDSSDISSPSIFNESITPSYTSPENELFFDTDLYSKKMKREEVKALLESGISHYRAGKTKEGLDDLKKAWTLAPDMASTGVALAMYYIKNKQYPLALEVAKKQRITFPTKPYAANIEGFAYQGLKDKTKSIAAFTQALKLDPGNSTASLALADYALKENNLKQARKLYIDILNYHPYDMRALFMLSRVDGALGDTKEVEKLIENAIKTAPDTAPFHYGFAKIYQAIKNYPQAIIEIKKAIKLEPDNAAIQFFLAKLLILNNQLNDSRDILSKLADRYPDNPAPRELEGRIALAQNQPEEAIKLFQQARSIKDSTSIIMHLATAQILSGKQQLGLNTLRQQVKKEPKNILLRKLFAEQLNKQGKDEEAIQNYEEIIRQQPGNPLIMNNFAWLLAKQGNIDKALHIIKNANNITPSNPSIMDTYGVILMEKGNLAEAEKILNKAIKKSPTDLEIQFHLSQVLAKAKKIEAAKTLLNRLLSQNNSFPQRQEAKKLLEQLQSH